MSDNDLIRREVDNECIKRGDVREHIQRYLSNRNRTTTELMAGLYLIPPADVKPVVKGEWIKCGRDGRPLCSKCGYEPLEITREYIVDGKLHSWDGAYNLSNFCPNCGADMRKEDVRDER